MMMNCKLEVKRIGDHYYITKGIGKLRTSIYPEDIKESTKVFPLMIDKPQAYIKLSNGKEVNVGFHTDYIRRYFEL